MGKRKQRKEEAAPELVEETGEAPSPGDLPSRGFEALAILVLVAALLLSFSLFSSQPDGPNLVGPVGESIATFFLKGFGRVGYLIGTGGIVGALLLLVGRLRAPSWLSLVAIGAIVSGLSVLAYELFPDAPSHEAGGIVGRILGAVFVDTLGRAGAAVVATGIVLLGLLGMTRFSVSAVADTTLAITRHVGAYLWGHIQIWRRAQVAARDREEEILQAARARRAQAKRAQALKAQELEEKLQEKARLAVLKATAKAEERALKKLAKQEAEARIMAAPEVAAGSEPPRDDAPVTPATRADDDDEAAWANEADWSLVESEVPLQDPSLETTETALVAPPSEPEIRTPPIRTEDAADALASFGVEPIEADEDPAAAPPADAAKVAASDVEAAPIEALPEDIDAFEGLGDGPRIHERLAVEADFDSKIVTSKTRRYEMPPLNLLDYEGTPPEPCDEGALKTRATRLENKLRTYGVEGKVTAIRPGPVVTTYEYQPAPGVKVSKIANLADDIAMSMEALRVRIVAPIPGRGVVGIELPNEKRENVYLKELIADEHFTESESVLTLAFGKDAEGNPQVRDLARMPHLLIAGTTGSGKSVSINTMILSILYKATPEQVKFIMVDPKMLELSLYEDIPHLLLPVVTDPKKASRALQWAVDEMERRYQMLSDLKVRDITGFNRRLKKLKAQRKEDMRDSAFEDIESDDEARPAQSKKRIRDPWPNKDLPEPMPYIVVLIDEFADLMCVAPRDVEGSVQRLAQKARAAGIHVLLATQRPSTDVITGVIKNNFPSRVSFRVASRHDSATILNAPGAENLLGMGDSLFLSVASPSPERIHGGFVSETEVERVVDFWKSQAKPNYDPNILKPREDEEGADGLKAEDRDEMYDLAVQFVTETRKASISAVQRRLRIGYNRAARMVEMMEVEGIVSAPTGPKGEREILVQSHG